MSVTDINVKVAEENQKIADAFKLFTIEKANEIVAYQTDDTGIFMFYIRGMNFNGYKNLIACAFVYNQCCS